MFNFGEIWAFPTDTSFGLGVRCDDEVALENLFELKRREGGKYFSLMVKDWAMLQDYGEVPSGLSLEKFQVPFTLILKPKAKLPKSQFWPEDKVAFRVCPVLELAKFITVPVTATSANFSGEPSIYDLGTLKNQFGDQICYYQALKKLPETPASQIWDYTVSPPQRLR